MRGPGLALTMVLGRSQVSVLTNYPAPLLLHSWNRKSQEDHGIFDVTGIDSIPTPLLQLMDGKRGHIQIYSTLLLIGRARSWLKIRWVQYKGYIWGPSTEYLIQAFTYLLFPPANSSHSKRDLSDSSVWAESPAAPTPFHPFHKQQEYSQIQLKSSIVHNTQAFLILLPMSLASPR